MRFLIALLKGFAALAILAIIAGIAWLYLAPPALIRVGAGYAAKIVCSNTFVANRDPHDVFQDDVQAPGNPLLGYFDLDVSEAKRSVTASFLGYFGSVTAIARPGLGCAVVPDGNLAGARAYSAPAVPDGQPSEALWPEGDNVQLSQNPALNHILDDPGLAGPGMRALVVVKSGRIIGERYGGDFADDTPLIGWSMTKTVDAALVGTVIQAGKLKLDQQNLLPEWRNDKRKDISVADLMAMSSGLAFNEDYGDVSDVTRMLFLEPDMAKFAASMPLVSPIGKVFHYSSGTGVILARIWQNAVGDEKASLAWPQQALFGPLGMTSAVLETDEAGTFAASSYLYATARDWARFGLFLLEGGRWQGKQILPPGFVAMMHQPAPASHDRYGKGLVWLVAPGQHVGDGAKAGLPGDTFWMDGHDGQSIAIIPSKGLVVVRLGLTPGRLHYHPQALAAALVKALP
ncbi:MAG: serine hydrolase domain-containing protein [Rhizobiaceae bacterium]